MLRLQFILRLYYQKIAFAENKLEHDQLIQLQQLVDEGKIAWEIDELSAATAASLGLSGTTPAPVHTVVSPIITGRGGMKSKICVNLIIFSIE